MALLDAEWVVVVLLQIATEKAALVKLSLALLNFGSTNKVA